MPSKTQAFPKAGRFEIHSSPIFLLSQGNQTELLIMRATMQVRTGDAYVAGGKKRRVDVEVADWVATGRSKMLGGKVEFRLSKDKRQPKSFVTAGTRKGNGDFPAQLRFGMRYDVNTPRGSVTGLTGVAKGPISAFPPKAGDMFNIQKDLKIGNLVVKPVACACASEALVISLPA
ncbi:MAG: hypothetical protein AABN34_14005 [Acidobacteriota bacterium]